MKKERFVMKGKTIMDETCNGSFEPIDIKLMSLEELYCYEKMLAIDIENLQEDGMPEETAYNYAVWRAKHDALKKNLKEVQTVISWKEKDA